MRLVRTLSVATVAAALVLAPLSPATAQQADQPPVLRPAAAALNNPLESGTYPGDTPGGPVIVVFSNSAFTDPFQEDWDIATVLLPTASELRVTDGEDGSAAAWTTILAGADVLVLPEGDNWAPGGTSAIGDDGLEVIRTWVSAGRTIVGTGSYDHGRIVTELTGVGFYGVFRGNDSNGPWQRVSDDTSLPAEVPNANYAGGLSDYSLFNARQKAAMTLIYFSAANDSVGIAAFAVGDGAYIYNAYDWYSDSELLTNGVRDAWNGALVLAATGDLTPPDVPELAATGDGYSLGVFAGAIILMLGGLLTFVVARRRLLAQSNAGSR